MNTTESRINVLKARKKQILNSPLFKEEEVNKMVAKLDKEINDLAKKLDVNQPEIL